MSEEFNIFKNLEDLRKSNFLDQLKSLESTETVNPNDSQGLENDDFDFDSIVNNNNLKKSPLKRQQKEEKLATHKKQFKKNTKSRRSSLTSDGSISPTMPLFDNLSKKLEEMPVGRITRRSLRVCKRINETATALEGIEPSPSNVIGRGRGRGRGKGRGRGRGRGRGTNTSPSVSVLNNSAVLSESSQCVPSMLSSTEVSSNDEESSDYNTSTLTVMERFLQRGRRGRLRVMRGRRQCLSEIAARSTNVDYIDLVSSPMPRVEGFIDLDSDVEDSVRTTRSNKKRQDNFSVNSRKNKNSASNNTVLNISFDEDNPELNIKVNWKGKLEAFKLRKHQKFSIIFQQLAERENINIDSIVFNLNDRIIMADDSPDSINYKIFHFIDGRVLTDHFHSPRAVAAAGKRRDANQISLKIQSDKWKRPLQINIMKTDKFRILYIKCAEELNVGVDQLKLSFDGELLELNDTPTDLDLEGGEAIDLRIKT